MATNRKKKIARTPEQKRVQIARDVIKQIRSRRYAARRGLVFSEELELHLSDNYKKSARTVVKRFLREEKSCEVCAKGACLLAYIERYNRVSAEACALATENQVMHNTEFFSDVFPPRLLAEIETLFERTGYELARAELGWLKIDIIVWYSRLSLPSDSEARLVAIMQALIKNRGKFCFFPEIAEQPEPDKLAA